MLPLWRDQIGVELSPQCVAWVRLSRGLHPEVVKKGREYVLPLTGEPAWKAALLKLEQLIIGEEWKSAELTVVLSSHFVRYDCIPWNEGVSNEDELLALARHRLTHTYGPAAKTWVLRISPAGKGDARLVAALDHSFLEILKQTMTEAGIKLCSIQPFLMSSFNHYAKSLVQGDGWFVAAEKGRFAMALIRGGQWKCILLRRGDDMATLHEWLERENLASGEGISCREVFLFGPELPRDAALPSYHVHRLELPACQGYSSITDAQYAIAMSGVA